MSTKLPEVDPSFGGSLAINRADAKILVASTLNLAALNCAMDGFTDDEPIKVKSNKEFWKKVAAGELTYPERIKCSNFFISEWVPSYPGRYFTVEAALARRSARYEFHEEGGVVEFKPSQKRRMVLGGVGTVRLAPRQMKRQDIIWLGATSDGFCHKGIPVICPMNIARKLRPCIHRHGGVRADIVGSLWTIEEHDMPIAFDIGTPQIVLFCEEIKNLEIISKGNLVATGSIMFDVSDQWKSMYEYENLSPDHLKGWTFKSFDPAGGREELAQTVRWLKDYMLRYGPNIKGNYPNIFSDFDETISHFKRVEIPLSRIMNGGVDSNTFVKYVENFNLTVNGDASMVKNIKYEVSGGQVGAFGEQASVGNLIQSQTVSVEQISYEKLAVELLMLRQSLINEAKKPEDFLAISAIVEAEQGVKDKDEGRIYEYLKKSGQWALDVATKIGVSVATEAIKKSMSS